MEAYTAFYETAKKWMIHDYWTPGFKAEVFLDTLISEFAAVLVSQALGSRFTQLAKEVPIPRENDRSARNEKVDFLLSTGDTLYLTELKTTAESFRESQMEHMALAAADGPAAYFDFYVRVQSSVQKIDGKLSMEKKRASMLRTLLPSQYQPVRDKVKIKYRMQLLELLGNPELSGKTEEEQFELLERAFQSLRNRYRHIKLIYLLPERTEAYDLALERLGMKYPNVTVETVLLPGFQPESSCLTETQRILWRDCVAPILDACFQKKPTLASLSGPGPGVN